MAVFVLSRTHRSEPCTFFSRIVSTSSRFRRVAESSSIYLPVAYASIRLMFSSPFSCVSYRYCRSAPHATAPVFSVSIPIARRLDTRKCFRRTPVVSFSPK